MEGDIGLHFGLALHMSGQQALAIRSLTALMSGVQLPAAFRSQLIGGLVFIHLFNCDLPRAEEQARALVAATSECQLANTKAWSQYLLAFIHFQANELDPALHLFAQIARERHVIEPKGAVDALAGMALSQELMGRTTEADETLDRLEGFARELSSPEYLLVADSCRARVKLLRGEIGAGHWARSVSSCTTPDALFTWLEVPAITRARILLAFGSTGSLRDAADQLQEIRHLSEACRFTCQTIEVALLQVLVLEKQGRRAEALESLDEVVRMAAPGGWVRPFVEAGEPMIELLDRLAERGDKTDGLRAMIDGLRAASNQPAKATTPQALASERRLRESLTRRELDILALVAQRLQNKEIAARLFVSVDTVKTHLKNLYGKLGVGNRREAAAKAAAILAANPAGTDAVGPEDGA